MGQTLPNGIYLPAEGERNCYDGLEGNWRSLDGLISTVSGKASATHTHGNITTDGKLATADRVVITDSTKSFTTSNVTATELSYLSGVTSAIQTQLNAKANDSDVVHKSGNESIAGEKTFSGSSSFSSVKSTGVVRIEKTSGDTEIEIANKNIDIKSNNTIEMDDIRFLDKNNKITGGLRITYNNTQVKNAVSARSWSSDGSEYSNVSIDIVSDKQNNAGYIGITNDFLPLTNNSLSLGSSSYQWNNLYAKNYFYNGTAWGLDKANVWSNIQTVSYSGSNVAFALKHTETNIASSPTRNNWFYINFYDVNSISVGGFCYSKRTSGDARLYLNLRTKNANSDIIEKNIFFETNQEGTIWNLYPSSNADINLGTSTNKWKTLNGLNPGALSLPDTYINIDTTNWNLTGTLFTYTPLADGWFFVNVRPDNNYAYVALEVATMRSNSESTTGKNAMASIAVRANVAINITIVGASIAQARMVYCAGNV